MATNGSHPAATPPLFHRSIKATTISFSLEDAPAGEFTVRLTCYASLSIEFCRRSAARPHDVVEKEHADGSDPATFVVADPAGLRSAVACGGALCSMVAALPQIRSLRLAVDEWNALVPWDAVRELMGAARRGNGFTFCLVMKVHRRVIHDERALTLACKERLATTEPEEKKDCAICLSGLEGEFAVDMPGCEHAFHRRCISGWFGKAATCPTCRRNVWPSALRELVKLSFTIV